MECVNCRVLKLDDEFPDALTSMCQHVTLWCLRCWKAVLESAAPDCPECGGEVDGAAGRRAVEPALARLQCPVYATLAEKPKPVDPFEASGRVTISLLDGQQLVETISQDTTIRELKERIARVKGFAAEKQRLYCGGRELATMDSYGIPVTWRHCNVPFDSTIQMVLVMYEIQNGQPLQRLVFELSWVQGCNSAWHLNGTCFACNAQGHVRSLADFRRPSCEAGAVTHGGPSSRYRQSQSLEVRLAALDRDVELLAFSLSASGFGFSLNGFRSLTVRLLDATTRQCLAEQTTAACGTQQAMVLCFAVRRPHWRVVFCGRTCDGHHHDYSPIEHVIRHNPLGITGTG
eukprot:EG_transcript_18152